MACVEEFPPFPLALHDFSLRQHRSPRIPHSLFPSCRYPEPTNVKRAKIKPTHLLVNPEPRTTRRRSAASHGQADGARRRTPAKRPLTAPNKLFCHEKALKNLCCYLQVFVIMLCPSLLRHPGKPCIFGKENDNTSAPQLSNIPLGGLFLSRNSRTRASNPAGSRGPLDGWSHRSHGARGRR